MVGTDEDVRVVESEIGEGVMVGTDESGVSTALDVPATNMLNGRNSKLLKLEGTVMPDRIRGDVAEALTGIGETRPLKA